MLTTVGVLAAMLATGATAQEKTVYFPVINANRIVTLNPNRVVQLLSQVAVFNASDSPGTLRPERVFGIDGARTPFPSEITLDPGTSTFVPTSCGIDTVVSSCLEFAEYRVSSNLTTNGTLKRVLRSFGADCGGPAGEGSTPEGRIPLPVFEGIFPAGSTAVSGDVVPFNDQQRGEVSSCAIDPRRINLTLLNVGTQSATFRVTVRQGLGSTLREILSTAYSVAVGSVRQINSFVEVLFDPAPSQGNQNLWVTITADQPFLSYVSTVFDDPQPGAIPYEIFPSKLR